MPPLLVVVVLAAGADSGANAVVVAVVLHLISFPGACPRRRSCDVVAAHAAHSFFPFMAKSRVRVNIPLNLDTAVL